MNDRSGPGSVNMEKSYQHARERYAAWGLDTDAAIARALDIPISLHCWQADDNVGFEPKNQALSGGGILATGNYPGRARNAAEVRADLAKAISLIPGKQRVNVHSYYAEFETGFADRDELTPDHFKNWMKWAAETGVALDFNPSFHAPPKAESGFRG